MAFGLLQRRTVLKAGAAAAAGTQIPAAVQMNTATATATVTQATTTRTVHTHLHIVHCKIRSAADNVQLAAGSRSRTSAAAAFRATVFEVQPILEREVVDVTTGNAGIIRAIQTTVGDATDTLRNRHADLQYRIQIDAIIADINRKQERIQQVEQRGKQSEPITANRRQTPYAKRMELLRLLGLQLPKHETSNQTQRERTSDLIHHLNEQHERLRSTAVTEALLA